LKSVAHVITTISRGGAENQLKVLVREQIKSGYEVKIFYLKDKPELASSLEALGAKVDHRLFGHKFFMQYIILRKVLKNHDGIVHAHLPRAELISAAATKGRGFIVSRHNAEPFFPGAPRIVSKLLSRYVVRYSKMVIAISKAVSEFLLLSGEIKNVQKLKVIYYGYDTDLMKTTDCSDRSLHSHFTVGTVARLVPQKDFPTLLQAFQRFLIDFPDSRLLIVGTGILDTKLRELSDQLEISAKITWYGKTDDVITLIQQMDLFVLPSKYEGFGLVLLEAIQAGTPVVAAKNSAILEVLGTDSAGLFPTGNSDELFRKLIQFQELSSRNSLAAEQRIRLEFFNPLVMIEAMNKSYQEVMLKA
jgi:glycosyltransferase involved in cell wall biosynthesis